MNNSLIASAFALKKKTTAATEKTNIKSIKTEWVPLTRLGRLVKQGKIKSIDDIFYFSIPIKEPEIIDFFMKQTLKNEVLKIMSVQKQTRAGQRTRFKAFVVTGDHKNHIGLGIKTSKEVSHAIKGALVVAKLSMIPVKKGHWGEKIGEPHTIPSKVTGKCGSVRLRCVPAPKGTGIVAGKISQKLLAIAGYHDIFTTSRGHTRTLGNFCKATFMAIYFTYVFLTPDFWTEKLHLGMSPDI